MLELPKDYDGILNDYDAKKAEPGLVKLINPGDLKVEELYIEGPRLGESYYSIPAVNLISECEDYEPEFILCYLPNEQKYGSWDCDHWVLYCFEDVNWNDIKNNPLRYLNCQWSEDHDFKKFEPKEYEVINGWPI